MKTGSLSPAEFQVAERISLGQTKKEVANDTYRSVFTVESTMKNIYHKLQIHNVSELTLWYCSQVFGIGRLIAEKRREIIALCFLAIFSFDLAIQDDDFCRIRSRRRRVEEMEFILPAYEN